MRIVRRRDRDFRDHRKRDQSRDRSAPDDATAFWRTIVHPERRSDSHFTFFMLLIDAFPSASKEIVIVRLHWLVLSESS